MSRTLGLDLGSNSLGWAVIDDSANEIAAKGVVIYPEGIEREKGNDTQQTPAATRREKRMGRRLKFRRKLRKWHLLSVLIRNGVCPLTESELEEWKSSGKFPVDNAKFLDWMHSSDESNPYADRSRAASELVEPSVLGRALYHICLRRGFKSSRKDAVPDTGDEKLNASLADKNAGAVKAGIAELTRQIESAGVETLGQYFFQLIESEKQKPQKCRVRKHYTGRVEHYEKEFSVIMSAQGLDENNPLRKELHDAIFMQRPLRSQRHLVGNCPLEPKSPRTFTGHPMFEEFRMWAFINNLTFDTPDGTTERLTAADRDLVATAFDYAATTFKFKRISNLFKKDPRFKLDGWRFHHYRDDESLPSRSVAFRIQKNFADILYDEQTVVNALMFYEDVDKLHDWFRKHYPALTEEAIARLSAIRPNEATAKYSLKAIRKILPFLRKGHQLFEATFLAKLPDVIRDYPGHEAKILQDIVEMKFQYDFARKNAHETGWRIVPLLDRYRAYFLENWCVMDEDWDRLYFLHESPYVPEKKGRVPEVQLGMIRNPLVQRSLTTLRRLVNYLHDHGVIDEETTIRIELARDVNNYATRKGWSLWQKERQKLRADAVEEILKLGVAATDDAVARYLLWKEQDGKCIYTGRSIGIADLFGNGVSVDIEHTIPRSRSGDDSLANKTLCDAHYNREVKKGRIPTECPDYELIEVRLRPWRDKLAALEKDYAKNKRTTGNPEARAKAICTRFELDYWRDKLRRFEVAADALVDSVNGLGGFKKRQLVDTGIMTRHAVELLKSVYPHVFAVNGSATAFARKAWGVQATDERKDRTSHVHHAKDAMVIAALTPRRFTAICTALKDDGTDRRRECDICPPPWPGFADAVRRAADEILVKHVTLRNALKQSTKQTVLAHPHPAKNAPGTIVKYVNARGDTVRGQLHADTFYGCIQKPGETATAFVIRKPLIGKNLPDARKLAPKIVDATIRAIVEKRLDELEAGGAKTVEANDVKMPSGVPINKVRIYAKTTNPAELRMHATPSKHEYKNPYYVTSTDGSNFRMALFNRNGELSVVPDKLLAWAQNHKKEDYVPLDRQDGFLGFICRGSMALVHSVGNAAELKTLANADLVKRLYKVVNYEEDGRITCRLHVEARSSVDLGKYLDATSVKRKKGEKSIDLETPHELLRLSPNTYFKQMVFEGIHFKMMMDGSIRFL